MVIIASLILTEGISVLTNVPCSDDVLQMIELLRDLGAQIIFYADKNMLEVDTRFINSYKVNPAIMKKMRASVLVMGPLLARFSRADIALPGGCAIGERPIDFHIKNFEKMNVDYTIDGEFLIGVTKIKSSDTCFRISKCWCDRKFNDGCSINTRNNTYY